MRKLEKSNSLKIIIEKIKRRGIFSFFEDYGRFLSINMASAAPTMKIATIMPATAGTKYMSAAD